MPCYSYVKRNPYCDCERQNDPNCGGGHWKLIIAGSRFTKDAESRYAPIEGEALAAVHGLKSCRMFVLGCPNLTVAVDHQPLLKIWNDQALETIENPRLLKLKEKTLMYRFEVVHVPGEKNKVADVESRNPYKTNSDDDTSDEVEAAAISYAAHLVEDFASVAWGRVRDCHIG